MGFIELLDHLMYDKVYMEGHYDVNVQFMSELFKKIANFSTDYKKFKEITNKNTTISEEKNKEIIFSLTYKIFEIASLSLYIKERGYSSIKTKESEDLNKVLNNIRHNKSIHVCLKINEGDEISLILIIDKERTQKNKDIEIIKYSFDAILEYFIDLLSFLKINHTELEYKRLKNMVSKEYIEEYIKQNDLNSITRIGSELQGFMFITFFDCIQLYHLKNTGKRIKVSEDVGKVEEIKNKLFSKTDLPKIEGLIMKPDKPKDLEDFKKLKETKKYKGITFKDYYPKSHKKVIFLDKINKNIYYFISKYSVDQGEALNDFNKSQILIDKADGIKKEGEVLRIEINDLIKNIKETKEKILEDI